MIYSLSLVRPDVLNELLKYPEVFFIRELQKTDDSFEVWSYIQNEIHEKHLYIYSFLSLFKYFIFYLDDSGIKSSISRLHGAD